MDYRKRIGLNPDIMLGKPTVKGTRITVEIILRKLSEGASEKELLESYPHLKREDILAAVYTKPYITPLMKMGNINVL